MLKTELSETCYVCLRITPELVLKLAHKIWNDQPEKAREKGKQASKIIEDCYKQKPWFFCGRTYRTILGGLFYLLSEYQKKTIDGLYYRKENSMKKIGYDLETTEVGVRQGYLRWKKSFPKLIKKLDDQLIDKW